MVTSDARLWRDTLARAVITAVVTIAFAWGLVLLLGDQVEQETAENVQILVDESRANREVLCLAVLRPSVENEIPPLAWQRIEMLCATVDVRDRTEDEGTSNDPP